MQRTSLTAVIDHKLRVRTSDLPAEVLSGIQEALDIPNLVKQEAKRLDQWGWERLPDTIPLYEFEHSDGAEQIVMPRGFLFDFFEGMEAHGFEVQFDDRRTWKRIFPAGTPVAARPWQIPQINALRDNEQGILRSPAGSGKTVAILATIQRLGCKSIVIVNTKDVLWQWQKRVADFLGPHYPFGQIGDGKFDISPYITIATAQTIHSRYEELEARGFFDEFSLVCLDECHHATAITYNTIINRFSARYRVGVSATPDKTGDFLLATRVLGPVIHVTRPDEVSALTKPIVYRVPTQFGFFFRGHKNRWQRSNYPDMINALIRDPDRNSLIVHWIMQNQGHHQLLVSKRLEHLSTLQGMLEDEGFRDPITTITGRDDNEHRQAATDLAESHPCLILSTLADEALDIPRLDRLHLPFPQRNTGLITQQVGRVERVHPLKKDARIYDYVDGNIGALLKQYRARRFEVYEPRGYTINLCRRDDGWT